MGLFPTAGVAIVADLAPPERRGEAMGVFGMASYVGMVFGPVIGVALDRHPGFLALCLASGALGWLGVALASRVPETGQRSVPPPPRLSALFAAAVLRPATITLTLFLAYGSVIAFLPVLVEARQVGNAGAFFACVAVAVLAVRTHSGQLSDRLGRGAVVLPAMATVALALALLAWAHSPGRLYAAGILLGLGLGGAQPPLMAWCADLVPPAARGKAMGTFHTAWELGIGAGSILFGLFLPLGGFEALLFAAAAVALAGGLGALARSGRARIS
jgi:MFS family permease